MGHPQPRHLRRRAFLLGLTATGATALLAACGATATPTTAPTAPAAPRPSAAAAASAAPSVAGAAPAASAAATSPAGAASPTAANARPSVAASAAPSAAPSAARLVGGGLLRASIPFLPQTLDPGSNTSAGSTIISMGLGETLLASTPQGVAQPWLAESVEPIEPTRWRIRLREGITFHNGKPLDGPAVQRSLARTLEKNAIAANLLNAAKVEAQDARTVILEMKGPNGGVREILTVFYLVIHDAEEAAKVGDAAFAQKPMMTGPFAVADFRPGDFVGLRRYDTYWQGAAAIERAEFRNVADANARLASVLAGDVELARTLPPQGLAQLRAANLPVVTAASAGMYHIFTNNKRFPFDDKAVRQALGLAVDRKTLIERVLNGGEHARGVYPANLPFAGPTPLPFDLARARQLLDGANWRAGGDGVRTKDGKKLEFELLTYPQRPELGLMATAIQAMLKDAGMAVAIRSVEDITKPVNAGDYTATMYSIQTAPTGDPSYILNLIYRSTAAQNVQLGYQSPALDAVIDKLNAETDSARRTELAREAQGILIEDAPATYLMQPLIHIGHTPKLSGIEAHPVEQYLLNHRWKLG